MARSFTYGGVALALTPREHAVLEALITRAGRAVSKEKLFAEVFTLDDDANLDAIEIYIHRLRKKLERVPKPAGSPSSPCAASATCSKRSRSDDAAAAADCAPGALGSLRGQLLRWLLIPLGVLVAINAVSVYRNALDAADLAYDRSLLASTRALAERVSIVDGKVVADVPYVALDSFETDTLGRIYYKVDRHQRRIRLRLRRPAAAAAEGAALRHLPGAGALLSRQLSRRAGAHRRPATSRCTTTRCAASR